MEINEWEMLCVLNPDIKLGALKVNFVGKKT